MSQITIRELDPNLELLIRQKSEAEKKSLNTVVQDLLKKAVGLGSEPQRKRNLTSLAGTWTQDEADAFEQTQVDFQKVDEDLWK